MAGRTAEVYKITRLDLGTINDVLRRVQDDMDRALGTNQSINAGGRPIRNVGTPERATDAALHGQLPSAASSITNETEFGMEPQQGTSGSYAREDHGHGSPPEPWAIDGYMLINSSTNPADIIGFGVWTQVAHGTFTVGTTPIMTYVWKRTG